MAKQDFELNGEKFVSGGRATVNGVKGRLWARYVKQGNGWAYVACDHFPLRATRKDISNGHRGY